MNTQAIKHEEIINLVKAQVQLNEALIGLISKLEKEENEEKYILVKEAAKIAAMSESNVRYLITTKQIKAERKGKKWMVFQPSLLEHLKWEKD